MRAYIQSRGRGLFLTSGCAGAHEVSKPKLDSEIVAFTVKADTKEADIKR